MLEGTSDFTCFPLIIYVQNITISLSMNSLLFKAFSADQHHRPYLETCWEMQDFRPRCRAMQSEFAISHDPQVTCTVWEAQQFLDILNQCLLSLKTCYLPLALTCQTGPREWGEMMNEPFSQMARAEFVDLCVREKKRGSKDRIQKQFQSFEYGLVFRQH